MSPKNNVKKNLTNAKKAMRKKDWLAAVEHYRKVIDANLESCPEDVYVNIATAYRNLQDFVAAENILTEGGQKWPDSVSLLAERAILEMQRKNWGLAFAHWKAVEKHQPNMRRRFIKLYARTCEKLGYWQDYERIIGQAFARYPEDGEIRSKLLHSFVISDVLAGSIDAAERKLELLEHVCKGRHKLTLELGFVKKYIRLEKLKYESDSDKRKKALEEIIGFQTPVRLMTADVLGLAEYLELLQQSSTIHFEGAEALKNGLNDLVGALRLRGSTLTSLRDDELLRIVEHLVEILSDIEIKTGMLPVVAWHILANVALAGMRFDVYYKLRRFISDCYLSGDFSKKGKITINQIRALNEFGEKEQLRSGVELAQYDAGLSKKYGNCIALSRLYLGDVKGCRKYFSSHMRKQDIRFRRYIKGKSVAIVGPVDVGLNNGAEIDAFDEVIRFNYKGLNGYDKDRFGSKTTLSYYLDTDVKKKEDAFVKGMEELQYVMYQAVLPRKFKKYRDVKTPMRASLPAWNDASKPLFKGNPNALQKCLLDLLRFEVGRVKIFNVTLWLGNKVNPVYRRKSSVKPSMLIWHDIVSNFVFTKRMFDVGLIEADPVLQRILSLSVEEYVMQFNEQFGVQRAVEDEVIVGKLALN